MDSSDSKATAHACVIDKGGTSDPYIVEIPYFRLSQVEKEHCVAWISGIEDPGTQVRGITVNRKVLENAPDADSLEQAVMLVAQQQLAQHTTGGRGEDDTCTVPTPTTEQASA